jgi:AcrR family transcriptional regulator
MKKNEVRQALVDTASRLFYTQGYNNTGINQIIEESGVVKSTMYQNIKSKEELLLIYLQTAGEQTNEALEAAAAKGKTPKQKVLAVFDYLEELVKRKDYYGCQFLNIVSEMPRDARQVRKQIKKQKDGVRALFARILEPIDKADLADEIYTLFEGALIANKVHGDAWPVVTARNIVNKII